MWGMEMIHLLCLGLIRTKLFQNLVLVVIILNSVKQITFQNNTSTSTFSNINPYEAFFLIFYTIEMVVKIIGMGLVKGKYSYLRDMWNIMDLIIVLSSLLPLLLDSLNAGAPSSGATAKLDQLRTLRILRPLKTIKNIKALSKIMHALDKAMKTLINVIILQWVMYLLFAITFMNLLVGKFKQVCFLGEMGLTTGMYTTTSIP